MMIAKNPKALALVATVLCMASILWLMNTKSVNSALETNLQNEKLKSEALLSEKLLIEKDMEKMRGQLSSLKGINNELDDVVKRTEARMASQESELKKLKQQNFSLAQIKKQREELLRLQTDLENQLVALRASYADMETKNTMLSNTIAQLQEQNKLLSQDLNRAMFASMDHTQVQAVKGKKERLTIKAKRTGKLIANFEVPASLRNITFRVLDENGKVFTDKQGTIVSKTSVSHENAIASTDEAAAGSALQKVHMEYIPKQKMRSGIYTVEILNDNLYVGSLNVKLR
jgi:predicted RNase H-like nuclease (RuvC/YqgF family)